MKNARRFGFGLSLLVCAGLGFSGRVARAEEDGVDLGQLAEMSLEELMSVPVTSVAGVEQAWFRTPAAMYVITGEDVRRSGALTLAEALRMAPGVFVGQINAHTYTISPRGFNGGLANKTLVLIDGRRVYDPLFSGTFWNVQDVLLEDLDRIEVIRGPGPTLWGDNAVNGVINVTTKSARDTQGVYATTAIGTDWLPYSAARYGDELSDDSWYRVWVKYLNRDSSADAADPHRDAADDWSMLRGGFRIDGEGADDASWMIEGDAYSTFTMGAAVNSPDPAVHLGMIPFRGDGRASGGHLLGRIGQAWADDHGWSLLAYYDRTDRVPDAGFEVSRDSAAVEFRHYFPFGDRHDVIWGASIYHTDDRTDAGPALSFEPRSRELTSVDAFVQDTFSLVEDELFFMLGSKFGVNELTGLEVQPSARLWWTPNDRHTLWAAVSRAVRVPSRTELDSTVILAYVDTGLLFGGPPSGVLVPLSTSPGDELDSEELIAYEAGYRVRPADDLILDAAVFFNDYDRLIGLPPSILGAWTNAGEAESYGGELVGTWRAAENWQLEASYSYVRVQLHGPLASGAEGDTPRHQAHLRSYVDLTKDLEFNSALYYVDTVPTPDADPYLRLDLGLTWRPRSNLEIAVWGQNLLDHHHLEFTGNEVERAFYVQATLRF